MKKYLITFGLVLLGLNANAQILSSSTPSAAINNSNAFLDASTNYGSNNGLNSLNKGLVFPDVNLTTFVFENVIADGATFPSYYNGMVVYNTGAGTTLTTGINPSVSTTVSPGFYYFSNPNGATNGNVTGGVWSPISGTVRMTSAQRNLIASPAAGLTIFNTTTNCINFFTGSTWNESCGTVIPNEPSSGGFAVVSAYSCSTASAGTMTAETPVTGVTQTITATVTTVGSYSITTTANGVTFSGAGTFAGTGAQAVVLTATGTPTAAGSSSFTLNTTPNCSFSRTVASPVGTIASIDCAGATSNGTLTGGIGTTANSVSSIVSYTGGNGGVHAGQTVASTGVIGLVATLVSGSFASGSGTLTYTITGTPTYAGGTASFAVNIGGKTCALTRTVAAGPAPVTITSATSKIWMDRNLGATRVATSSTDHLAYGDLYQWGRNADGHQGITWTSATTGIPVNGFTTTRSIADQAAEPLFIKVSGDWRATQNDNLWQGTSGVNNPCPPTYRIPTQAELIAEFAAYSITNASSAYASPLKLAMAGFRDTSLSTSGIGYGQSGYTFLWSSTTSGTLAFARSSDSTRNAGASLRASGLSVRCVKD